MTEAQRRWLEQQAIERLAQHIPFEVDPQTKAECIEMLRGLVLRSGHLMSHDDFGFEAQTELKRLGLLSRIGTGGSMA